MKRSVVIFCAIIMSVLVTSCNNNTASSNVSTSQSTTSHSQSVTSSNVSSTQTSSLADNSASKVDKLLYEDNGIKITYTGIDIGSHDTEIKLLIENTSENEFTIQVRDCSVNGFMVDPVISADVWPNKKCNDSMTFYKSILDDNNIDQIKTIDFKFSFYKDGSIDGMFESETITLEI